MAALVLDAGALSALAARRPTDTTRRVRALLVEALARNAPVVVPSAVLAELYRGEAADAALDRVLTGRGVRVVTTGRAMARVAGALRHRDRLDSCHVVDCLVVATAVRMGGGLVATGDPDDLRRLARGHSNVGVHAIGGR